MPYTNTTVYWGTNEGGNGVEVWAYTAQFGNGLSASLSVEDPSSERNGVAFPDIAVTMPRHSGPIRS